MASERRSWWRGPGGLSAALAGSILLALFTVGPFNSSTCRAVGWEWVQDRVCDDPQVPLSEAKDLILQFAGTVTGGTPADANQFVDRDSTAWTQAQSLEAAVRPNHVVWWQVVQVTPVEPRNSFQVTYKEYVLTGPKAGRISNQSRTFRLGVSKDATSIRAMSKPTNEESPDAGAFPRVTFASQSWVYRVPRWDTHDNLQRLGAPVAAGTELTGLCQLDVPDPPPNQLTARVWIRTNQGWVKDSELRPGSYDEVRACGPWSLMDG